MDIDIDKDAIRRPAPATRRQRPSAVKCVVVLCSLIGLAIVATIAFFMGKGFYMVYDSARNPHKDLYLNSTVVEAGIEPIVYPFIGKNETFDVYFTIWARVPDALVDGTPELLAQEAASRERFAGSWDTIKKMTKQPDRELLSNPKEQVVFSERVFEDVSMSSRNLHKDISFELPLDRFRDKFVFFGDVRGAAVIVPRSAILDSVKEWSGWKPDGAKSLGRLDDRTAAKLDLSGLRRDVLDATSVSFGMIELHDKNYLNRTADAAKASDEYGDDIEVHDYFEGESIKEEDSEDESTAKLWKRWQTEQPHFVTKSHVYILDETRPLNRTAFDKKHKNLKEHACGLGMSLPPTRFLCNRISILHGIWENRIVVSGDNSHEDDHVVYGPKVDVLQRMSGPKVSKPGYQPQTARIAHGWHSIFSPFRFVEINHSTQGSVITMFYAANQEHPDEIVLIFSDQTSMTVHHQISFSSFTSGRLHMLDNFVPPHDVDKNATEAAIVQAHNDWEQTAGVFGNRAHGTHPRTRFILGFVEDILLSLPITILSLLYWYTRQTTTGIHVFGTLCLASCIVTEEIVFVYIGARSKTLPWETYVLGIVFSGFEFLESILMFRVVLPFEIVWISGWLPAGIRRTGWMKRERDTRRLEQRVTWTQIGTVLAAAYAIIFVIQHYDLYLVKPLHRMPNEHQDLEAPTWFTASTATVKLVAPSLQLLLNRQSTTFAGQYALEIYLVIARQLVRFLRFWPWFIGRYEVRGGIGYINLLWLAIEAATLWQALTLPRVEQAFSEEEEEE